MNWHAGFRRDLASAYMASAMRIGAWVVVSAIVYRFISPEAFAMLALVRATVGFLNNTSLGLGPALIHYLARAMHTTGSAADDHAIEPGSPTALSSRQSAGAIEAPLRVNALYTNAWGVALMCGGIGALLLAAYAMHFGRWQRVPAGFLSQMSFVVAAMGAGTLFRLMSDAAGATLQATGFIALDNVLATSAEALWVVFVLFELHGISLSGVAVAYGISGLFVLAGRTVAVGAGTNRLWPRPAFLRGAIIWQLLSFGVFVAVAQVADYLYAPTDYILINHLLSPLEVANYAPAVQIDAGLLLIVTALAGVLLPKAALAHAAGELSRLRKYYLAGTLISAAALIVASAAVWLLSPWIFRLWFGNPLSRTQVILPLVLIHTVIGGSSAVGRAVLLAMGKVRPFTIAALLAGAANVGLSYCFVHYGGLGLAGIVMGTVVVVICRCAIWMPWYIWRVMRQPI